MKKKTLCNLIRLVLHVFSCSESFIYMTFTVSLSRNYCFHVAHSVKCYVTIPPTLSSTMSHTMFIHCLQCLDATSSVTMSKHCVYMPPTMVFMSPPVSPCHLLHCHVTFTILMSLLYLHVPCFAYSICHFRWCEEVIKTHSR